MYLKFSFRYVLRWHLKEKILRGQVLFIYLF
jgi:hypothetical protein